MDKKYGFIDWPDVDDQTRFENVLQWIEKQIQKVYNVTINKLIKNRKQKIVIKIDNHDIWSADYTMALIITPILKKLKLEKRGAPLVDNKDVPPELRSTNASGKNDEAQWDDNNPKRWDWVLDEMIYAFESTIDEDWEDQFHSGECDYKYDKLDDTKGSYYRVTEGPKHTFKTDKLAMKKAWKRRYNGLRLFGVYYHALWD
jgi:hypothetical protein